MSAPLATPLGRRGQCPRLLAAPCPSSWPHPFAECGSSFYAYQQLCLPYCPPRSYGRTQGAASTNAARVCAGCHPSCYTCQGASANNCTACPPARVFDELSRSCPPLPGFSPEDGQHGDLLPVLLICGSLVLLAILCVTYRKVVHAGWLHS